MAPSIIHLRDIELPHLGQKTPNGILMSLDNGALGGMGFITTLAGRFLLVLRAAWRIRVQSCGVRLRL